MDPKVIAAWKRFLNPAGVKETIVRAGVFLCAYELLHQSVVDHVRSTYERGYACGKPTEVPCLASVHLRNLPA